MSKSSKSRTPKSGTAQRNQATGKRERVARWREGLTRVKEEGRLLWLLGQGLDVLLAAEENESITPGAEQVAAAVALWARQAMTAHPALQLGSPVAAERPCRNGPGRELVVRPVLAETDAMLDGKPLSTVWCPVLWMGSREWRRVGLTTVVVGVGDDGRRRVLLVRPGSIREQGLAMEVLSDLTARGLRTDPGLLVVTEGSRILDEALRQTWGARVLVSHCRRQLLDDLSSHLIEAERTAVCGQIAEAWALPPVEAAETLHRVAKRLQRSAPGAAERLGRSIEASLVTNRLEAMPPLQDRLVSLGTVNQAMQQAHALGDHGGGLADLLAGLSRWLVRTRRIMGWQQLGSLTRAIHEMSTHTGSENENCTRSSKTVQRKEKSVD